MVEIIPMGDVGSSIVNEIKVGKIFIYPTDTIYGLGCNCMNEDSVNKIRGIKKRDTSPFSVIAPSKEWIYSNLIVKNKSYIKKLPGPYTFIFKVKKQCVPSIVNNDLDTLGVRIPDHEFVRFITVPFITTSVNYSGFEPINDVKKIPYGIKKEVDYIIDGGVLYNKPSVIIDLTGEVAKIIKRKV